MNEVKVGKLPIIASHTWNFISKLESVIASQEKENKILCIANEEMGANTFDSR